MEDFAAIAVAVLGGERLVFAEPVLDSAAVARALERLVEGLVGFLVWRLRFPALVCHVVCRVYAMRETVSVREAIVSVMEEG